MSDESLFQAMAYFSNIGNSISNLVFVFDSTDRRLEQVYRLPYSSKYEMKLVGGTAFGHESKMLELGVLGMAKVVEDLLVMFKEDSHPHNIWGDFASVPGIDHAQMIRRLANLIKHNQSIITSGSQDGDSLINDFGFPHNFQITSWTRGLNQGGPNPCPYFNLYGIQQFCINAINQTCGVAMPVTNWTENEVRDRIVRQWLGDLLDIEAKASESSEEE